MFGSSSENATSRAAGQAARSAPMFCAAPPATTGELTPGCPLCGAICGNWADGTPFVAGASCPAVLGGTNAEPLPGIDVVAPLDPEPPFESLLVPVPPELSESPDSPESPESPDFPESFALGGL